MNQKKKGDCGKLVGAMALMLIFILALGSCSLFKKAQSTLCNPSDAQKTEAQAALTFITAALKLVSAPTLQAKLTAAESAFGAVQGGFCVALTDLENAIAAVDAASATPAPAQATAGATAMPAAPALPNLRKWVSQNTKISHVPLLFPVKCTS